LERDRIGQHPGIKVYAYVLGNPVTLNDSFGLAPGDSFPSVEAAAVDALDYISANLNCAKSEYGGVVYREWSLFGPPTYTYDEPTDLGPTGGIMPPLPLLHGTYALFHNHPPIQGYDSNQYSLPNEDAADSFNIPSYLLIPSGTILRYLPVRGQPEGGSVTPVAKTSCQCNQS
jgi:hypothetical protein